MRICEKIQTSSLGKDLSDDDCTTLSTIVKTKTLNQGEILFSAEETTRTLYVILNGKIDVTKNQTNDESLLIHTLHTGDMAGEMGFIDGDPHSLTLRANTDTELLCLDHESFEALLLTHPHLVYHVMRAITRATHHALRRMNHQYSELNKFITNQYMS